MSNPPSSTNRFLSPALADAQRGIPTSDYVAKVKGLFTLLTDMFSNPSPGLAAHLASIQRTTSQYLDALQRLDLNSITLIERRAYFESITSTSHKWAGAGASQLITTEDIPDIATTIIQPIAVPLPTGDGDLLLEIFHHDAWWWAREGDLIAFPLKPTAAGGNSVIWNDKWPDECFRDDHCGLGCPQPCANTVKCTSDFACQSLYCHFEENKNGSSQTVGVCQPKDYSKFPADFFTEYRTEN